MCYTAPGPRCSNHTGKRLAAAHRKLDKASEKVGQVAEKMHRHAATEEQYREAQRKYQAAQDLVLARQSAYDATPAGITELEQKANGSGSIARAQAQERLDRARATRERQFAAFRAAHRRAASPEEENGPEQVLHADPAVAELQEMHAASLAAQREAETRKNQFVSRVYAAEAALRQAQSDGNFEKISMAEGARQAVLKDQMAAEEAFSQAWERRVEIQHALFVAEQVKAKRPDEPWDATTAAEVHREARSVEETARAKHEELELETRQAYQRYKGLDENSPEGRRAYGDWSVALHRSDEAMRAVRDAEQWRQRTEKALSFAQQQVDQG